MSDIGEVVPRKEGFDQVCVWPATLVGKERIAEFEQFMRDEFGIRAQYLEEVETKPDYDKHFNADPLTGGRNDVIFAVHEDDIEKFALARLPYGIRWIEDVLAECNNSRGLYDAARLDQYKTW